MIEVASNLFSSAHRQEFFLSLALFYFSFLFFNRSLCFICADHKARLWDSRISSRPVSLFEGHSDGISSVSWEKPFSKRFLTASHDGTVRLWDIRFPKCLVVFGGGSGEGSEAIAGHSDWIRGFAIDGKR